VKIILIAHDKPGSLELRKSARPQHLAYLELISGKIAYGGPLLDPDGQPCGSVIIYNVESRDEAEQLISEDPYTKAELFGHVEIHGFRTVVRDGVVTG
jgi:uncharacterized protein YciI